MYDDTERKLNIDLSYDEIEILQEMFIERIDRCACVGEMQTVENLMEKLIGE